MIVTILRSFVDRKKDIKLNYGDVIDIPASDFKRYSEPKRKRPLVVKGQVKIKGGICYPCIKKKQLKEKKNG